MYEDRRFQIPDR